MLPASFRTQYDLVEAILGAAKEYLDSRLRAELNDLNPVVIQSRIKQPGSVYVKLCKGETNCLWELDDLVAARGVFLHPRQVQQALEVTRATFPIIEERNVDASKPTDFHYQQPHLLIHLPEDYVERHIEFRRLKLEVQFTTYVQHALQESTHDVIYKGGRFSWREHRLDGRLRGLLEIVDEVLENVAGVAGVGDEPPYPLFDRRNSVLNVVQNLFTAESLPPDLRRFAITVDGLLESAGLEASELETLAKNHPDLMGSFSLTPVDKLLGMLLRERGDQLLLKSRSRKFLVSPELETLVPETSKIPPDKRVSLS